MHLIFFLLFTDKQYNTFENLYDEYFYSREEERKTAYNVVMKAARQWLSFAEHFYVVTQLDDLIFLMVNQMRERERV